jgi:hypothetical protein
MLAAHDAMIAALASALAACDMRDTRRRDALRDMRLEWEAEAAGLPHYARHIKPGAVDAAPGAAG